MRYSCAIAVVGLLAALAEPAPAQRAVRAAAASGPYPTVVLTVREAGSQHPVPQPLVCVREAPGTFGAVGDSLGVVRIGGNLPSGTIHLRILAPRHLPTEAATRWPPSPDAKPVAVLMRPRSGPDVEPSC
ncbi:MAG: hypothetical protein U0132_16850 [Gemmatimonadaceae bacterium]